MDKRKSIKGCDDSSLQEIEQKFEDAVNKILQKKKPAHLFKKPSPNKFRPSIIDRALSKPIITSTPMPCNKKLSFSLKNEQTFSPIIKKYKNESRAVNSNNSKDHYINSVITLSSLINSLHNDEEINKSQHNTLVSELNSPKETEAAHFSYKPANRLKKEHVETQTGDSLKRAVTVKKKKQKQETDNFDSYLNELDDCCFTMNYVSSGWFSTQSDQKSRLKDAMPWRMPSQLDSVKDCFLAKTLLNTSDDSDKELAPRKKKVFQNRKHISNHKVNKSNETCENYVSSVKEKSNCSIEELCQDAIRVIDKYKGNAERRSERNSNISVITDEKENISNIALVTSRGEEETSQSFLRRDKKSFAKKNVIRDSSNQNNLKLIPLSETKTNSFPTIEPEKITKLKNKSSTTNVALTTLRGEVETSNSFLSRTDKKNITKKKRTCENSNQNNSELVFLTETNTKSLPTNEPVQELNNKSSARNKSTKNKKSLKKQTELLTNETSSIISRSQVKNKIKTDSKMLSPRLINSSDTLSNTGELVGLRRSTRTTKRTFVKTYGYLECPSISVYKNTVAQISNAPSNSFSRRTSRYRKTGSTVRSTLNNASVIKEDENRNSQCSGKSSKTKTEILSESRRLNKKKNSDHIALEKNLTSQKGMKKSINRRTSVKSQKNASRNRLTIIKNELEESPKYVPLNKTTGISRAVMVQTLELGDITGLLKFNHESYLSESTNEDPMSFLVLKGHAKVEINHKVSIHSAHSTFIVPNDTTYCIQNVTENGCLVLQFSRILKN